MAVLLVYYGFNPTLVRLRLIFFTSSTLYRAMFQSHAGSIEATDQWRGLVREMAFQSHAGSIEACYSRSQKTLCMTFQSHAGSIEAGLIA